MNTTVIEYAFAGFLGLGWVLLTLSRANARCAAQVGEARELLRWWAGTEGWTALKAEHSWRGPWWFHTSNRPVFRFTVRDDEGRTRSGWARCRGFATGRRRGAVEVRWDDPTGKTTGTGTASTCTEGRDEPLWDEQLDRGSGGD